MKRFYLLLSAVIAFAACQRICMDVDLPEGVVDVIGQEPGEVIITASIADGQQATRTSYDEVEAKNYWTPGDKIKVFSAGEAAEFTSLNTEPEPIVKFRGYIATITGSSNDNDDTKDYVWGLYPYSEGAIYEEPDGISRTARITTTYPDVQVGVAGTFGDNLSVMVGRSESLSVPFRGAYSGAFFQVNRDDIVSITLRGLNNEVLAGTATLGLNTNMIPVVHSVTDPKTSVTVTAPNGTFEPGENYYLITLPDVALPDGYSVTLVRSDGLGGTYEVRANRPLNRIKFRNLSQPVDVRIEDPDNIADGLSTGWIAVSPEGDLDPDAIIAFADPTVKALCVSKWDTDSDGELSYAEAAAVTTIPYEVFSSNTNITSFDEFRFFTGVTSLGYDTDYDEGTDYFGAFSGCTNLKSITLPPTLTTIPWGCFRGCSSLEELYIPKSVTKIQQVAFLGCTSLEIHMESETPCTLQGDGTYLNGDPCAFGYLYSIDVKAIYVPDEDAATAYKAAQFWPASRIHPEGWVDPSQNIVFKDAITELICVTLWDTNGDESLSYGEAAAVTDIGTTFQGVDISSFDEFNYFTGVTSLPESAFQNCKYLESISFPGQITTFSSAFTGCTRLNKVTIPSLDFWFAGLYTMRFSGIDLYINDDLLTEVTVPVAYSGNDYLLYGIKSLRNVIIEDGATRIGGYAFFACSSLTDITIPDGVLSVASHAFDGCKSLITVTIPESVNSLGNYAAGSNGSVFSGCSSLESIYLPTSVNYYYGGRMFADCSNLLSVSIPKGATSIGSSAFANCKSLISVTIPESVTSTGGTCFENCTSLESIILPDGLEELGQTISSSLYPIIRGCSSITEISLPASITSVSAAALDGAGIEKVEIYPNMLESSGLTNGLTYYYSVSRLCAVFASESNVKDKKYYSVNGPKEVVIKKSSITYSIPAHAFRYFFTLESVTLPNGLTSVGTQAFMNDYSLKSIDFPSTLKDIGYQALSGCSGLEDIWFRSTTPPSLGSGALATNNCPIYVPLGCVQAYREAEGWSEYADRIQVFPSQAVHLEGVSLTPSLTMARGSMATLTPTFTPSDATNTDVTWSSSNTSVATIDAQGNVAAVGNGTTTITVTTSDGGFTATCEVTVNNSGRTFPEGGAFDEDAYITYVANHQGWFIISQDATYDYDTYFQGVSGTRVEMKFQVPDYSSLGSDKAILGSCDDGSGNGFGCDASNVYYWTRRKYREDGDYNVDYTYTNLVDGGIDGTGVVVLSAEFNGNQITTTVNGAQKTISSSLTSFDLSYLFSSYYYEHDDGSLYEYSAGVPDGAKLYYVKIWNGNQLVYNGYAGRSTNPSNSTEEYCWYANVNGALTTTFAYDNTNYPSNYTTLDNYNPVRQPFGGGID